MHWTFHWIGNGFLFSANVFVKIQNLLQLESEGLMPSMSALRIIEENSADENDLQKNMGLVDECGGKGLFGIQWESYLNK